MPDSPTNVAKRALVKLIRQFAVAYNFICNVSWESPDAEIRTACRCAAKRGNMFQDVQDGQKDGYGHDMLP